MNIAPLKREIDQIAKDKGIDAWRSSVPSKRR